MRFGLGMGKSPSWGGMGGFVQLSCLTRARGRGRKAKKVSNREGAFLKARLSFVRASRRLSWWVASSILLHRKFLRTATVGHRGDGTGGLVGVRALDDKVKRRVGIVRRGLIGDSEGIGGGAKGRRLLRTTAVDCVYSLRIRTLLLGSHGNRPERDTNHHEANHRYYRYQAPRHALLSNQRPLNRPRLRAKRHSKAVAVKEKVAFSIFC